MAYSLRLPGALDAAARAKADALGISFNALVCVALDAYLRHPSDPQSASSAAPTGVAAPSQTIHQPEPSGAPVKLTRAQKQAIYEREKAERKRVFGR